MNINASQSWHERLFKNSFFIILVLVLLWPLGVILVWRSSWSTRGKWLATVISAVLWGLFWVIGILNAKPTLSLKDLSTKNVAVVEAETLRMEGKVYPYNSALVLNGNSISVDTSNGKFSFSVPLKEGDNSLVFKAADGDKVTTVTYTVHRMTKQEIADRDKRIAEERARKEAEEQKKIAAQKSDEAHKQEESKKATTAPTQNTVQHPSFKIDSYVKMPMGDIAKEFNQTYSWSESRQILAKKDGYDIEFEDAGKEDASGTKLIGTGYATHAIINITSLGKCTSSEVFSKSDAVIKEAGLDANKKGTRNPNVTAGAGYASYLNYKGDKSLELRVACKYSGGPWQVIITVPQASR